MWLWLLVACGGGSAERQSAQEALVDALTRRDPQEVSAAARRASAWEGEDPVLDGLLGDAVANVLMRPEQGWPLLMAAREVGGPAWETAALGATLRAPQGSLEPDLPALLDRSVAELGVRAEVRAAARGVGHRVRAGWRGGVRAGVGRWARAGGGRAGDCSGAVAVR